MRLTTVLLATLLVLAIAGTGWLYWTRPTPEPPRGPDFVLHPKPAESLEPFTSAFSDGIRDALSHHRFDELESTAARYRSLPLPHFVGGYSKLHEFYRALGDNGDCGCQKDKPPPRRPSADLRADLEAWYQSDPKSPTAALALAVYWQWEAWSARGSGYSSDMSDDQQQGMLKALSEADYFLERVDSKTDPEALYRIIGVAAMRGLNGEEFESLFQQAIGNYPTFYEYYSQHAEYSLERWYGDADTEKNYLDGLLAPARRPDGAVEYVFAEMRLAPFFRREELAAKTGLDLTATLAAYQTVEQRFGLDNQEWNALFYIAIHARQCQTSKTALQQIGDKWDASVWGDKQFFEDNVTFQHLHGHC